MVTAVAFVVIGLVWLTFRRWIASQQHRIIVQMTGRGQHADQAQIDALQKIGVAFAALLLVAGLSMLVLTLVFQR